MIQIVHYVIKTILEKKEVIPYLKVLMPLNFGKNQIKIMIVKLVLILLK